MLAKLGDALRIVPEPARRLLATLDVLSAGLDHHASRQICDPGPQFPQLAQRDLNRVLRVDLQEDFSDLVIV